MEMINAIGRRKSAVARVYLTEGTGKITINKVELEKYFPSAILQYVVKQPLLLLDVAEKYDIKVNLDGGGFTGQSQALRLAIARALYIEKLDISEEKQRLANHLKYFRETMQEGHGQGKKLGFIAQEMGREINTTGSKSNNAEMQNIVVKMKDELEQIKEQVLNAL